MDQYMREKKIEGVTAPLAKVTPVEVVVEPSKPIGDTKADTKAKPGNEVKEKPVTTKPTPGEKAGAKAPPEATAAVSQEKSPASVAIKVPAAAPTKAAEKEAPASH